MPNFHKKSQSQLHYVEHVLNAQTKNGIMDEFWLDIPTDYYQCSQKSDCMLFIFVAQNSPYKKETNFPLIVSLLPLRVLQARFSYAFW